MTPDDLANYNLGVTMFEIVLFWLVCAMIAAAIGNKKGEAGMGCLWGFLLGPIGILIAVLSDGDRVACPFCREKIHKAATVCPRCQRELTAPSSPPA